MSETTELKAAFAELRREVEAVLSGAERPLTRLAEACAGVRSHDPGARATEAWFRSHARSRDVAEITFGVTLALLVPERPWLDRICGPGGEGTLLPGRVPAARWITGLHRASPEACRQLLTAWLIRWRLAEGTAAVDAAVSLFMALEDEAATLAALEAVQRAAPQPADAAGRTAWNLALLRRARERLGRVFPPVEAARLALREGLLLHLSERELAELAPIVAGRFPGEAAGLLDSPRLAGSVLSSLLRACRDGLLEPTLGGAGWDLAAHPERWDLACRVAEEAASHPESIEDLSWLLWAASRWVGTGLVDSEGAEDPRLAQALLLAMEADAPEGAGALLRAFSRFWRRGALEAVRPRAVLLWPVLRRRALAEARTAGGDGAWLLGTLLWISRLDRELLTGSDPEGVSLEGGRVDSHPPSGPN
jgi:hypothetical protein